MIRLRLFLFAVFFLLSKSIFADTTYIPKAENFFTNPFFNHYTYSGYVDTSYNYLVRSNQFTSGVRNRVNDFTENGFTLQQASVIFSNQPERGFGWLISPVAGRDANRSAPYGWDPYFGSETLALYFPNAYLQYSLGSFRIIAGCFSPLAGAESYNPTKDSNFSRSVLDGYAEPGVLLGVRGDYLATKKLTLHAGLNDGWTNIRDTSRGKTVEVGGEYTFNSTYSLAVSAYTGMERMVGYIATGPVGRRNLINMFTTITPTDKLTVIAMGDYGMQTKAGFTDGAFSRVTWDGVGAYINYQWNETWRTSLRGEAFYDQNGYQTGVRQSWRELTLTFAYYPAKWLELRAETRHDFSNVNSFVNANGEGANNNQQSFAIEGLYKFEQASNV